MTKEDKIKQELTNKCGYDFDSDYWTDDMMVMFLEIVVATLNIENAGKLKKCSCCGSNAPELCGSCVSDIAQETGNQAISSK